ncbi:MAG TPA: flavocytochrome c [Clostridiaceae bacterium]|nr:flavocytochrome c [Clostridiaceae bacterium]
MKCGVRMTAWLVALVVLLSVSLGMTVPAAAAEQVFDAGTYEAAGDGYGGEVTVEVTVSEDRIEDIRVEHAETDAIGGSAIDGLIEFVLESQSLNTDAVSGATLSSDAFLLALEASLAEAGADVEALKAKETEARVVEDIETDVVVIGAGGAGMSAAIEAAEAGKDVVVLERMPIIGGNTNRATGGMNASETSIQEEKDIEDSNEVYYQDSLDGGHGINDPDLLRTMVEHSAESLDWVNELGAELNDVSFSGGATNSRIHKPLDGSAVGPIIVRVLAERLDALNVPIHLESEAVALIEEDGHVTGVEVVTPEGETFTVTAKAVVIATGGFGANMDMVKEYDESKVGFGTTNHPGALGMGITMAQEVGADTFQMEQIQIHPTTDPDSGYMFTEGLRGDGAILINKEGKRFIDELETRDVVSAAILAETDGQAYVLVNQVLVDQNKSMRGYIEQGYATSGETLDDLAAALDMDPVVLQDTLDQYNEAQASGSDTEFGRQNMTLPLDEGPYYVLLVTPSIHHTMGGLRINTNAEVLDKEGNPIPGLFAAGEVTGGVHGGNRIGGNAVTDIIVFGRIAGQKAAAAAD